MKGRYAATALLLATLALPTSGCLRVRTEHKIEPIEINVNVRVQMEREMSNFFDQLYDEPATQRAPR